MTGVDDLLKIKVDSGMSFDDKLRILSRLQRELRERVRIEEMKLRKKYERYGYPLNSCVSLVILNSVFDIADIIRGVRKGDIVFVGVVWGSFGSTDTKTARRFERMLSDAIKIADKLNNEFYKLLPLIRRLYY